LARKEIISYSLTCDMCGREAEGSYTVVYGGTALHPGVYEVDLCVGDAKKLTRACEALTAVLDQGRKVGGARRRASSGATKPSSPGRHAMTGAHPGTIRQWAREQGYEVSDRGRIPQDVVDAYDSAGGE
jgi:hypothetical protein